MSQFDKSSKQVHLLCLAANKQDVQYGPKFSSKLGIQFSIDFLNRLLCQGGVILMGSHDNDWRAFAPRSNRLQPEDSAGSEKGNDNRRVSYQCSSMFFESLLTKLKTT